MKNTEVALRISPFDTTPGKKEQAKITGVTQGDKIGRGEKMKKTQTEVYDTKNCHPECSACCILLYPGRMYRRIKKRKQKLTYNP